MKTNRRDFLKTLGGIAAFTIVPRHVLGNGFIAPSDQLTKGIIGTGGMGRGHVDYAGTRLVAVCDVDKNHLELGKQLVKDKIAAYHDFRDLILDPNVDIVHIATPPHWHGIMSVEAAKAGKDIWCEKPMTRTIDLLAAQLAVVGMGGEHGAPGVLEVILDDHRHHLSAAHIGTGLHRLDHTGHRRVNGGAQAGDRSFLK